MLNFFMEKKEFEKRNPDLSCFGVGPIYFRGDGSPDLEKIVYLLKDNLRGDSGSIILNFEQNQGTYFFAAYRKKK